MASPSMFSPPSRGVSLMLAFRMESKTTVVIGSNALAASRTLSALEAESEVIVLATGGFKYACEELQWRSNNKEIELLDFDELARPSEPSQDPHAATLRSIFEDRGPISFVCVTDTLLGGNLENRRTFESAAQIYRICRERNILVNVTDFPSLCDFSFAATHRFSDPHTGTATPLQVAVATNGKGCRLSGRIRREIVAKLPREVGLAVEKVGRLRDLARHASHLEENATEDVNELNDELTVASPNRPVPQRSETETTTERARRRMKWVAQVSEYWSITRLANLTDGDMADILSDKNEAVNHPDGGRATRPLAMEECVNSQSPSLTSVHSLNLRPRLRQGRILLVGSGPGHPSLLTIATHKALTAQADLVLTDKLVPAAVLALIPKHVEVRVARKFPGNAEGAQVEMMEAAVEAARAGRTVVRLKQGDPMLYGRAGEEVIYFRQHGFEAVVIPGVSSALAAPMFAGIPVTQRGVAESFIVCTGVGRQGKEVKLPGYERSRTLVILMGVARLPQMLEALRQTEFEEGRDRRRDGRAYPVHTPIALVERASMPDQRVITSTLQHIVEGLESTGEQRPPGLLVVGWAVLALWGAGDMGVLDGNESAVDDMARVEQWLDGKRWRVLEGIDSCWDEYDAMST